MLVGENYRARIYCYDSTLTQVAINTVYYQVQGSSGDGVPLLTFLQALDLAIAPVYKAAIANEAVYRGVTVQRVGVEPLAQPLVTIANTGAGTAGATTIPGQVSGLLSFKTRYSGVRYRGRIYIPFPSSNAQNAHGEMNTSYRDLCNDIGAQLIGPFNLVSDDGDVSVVQAVRSVGPDPVVPRRFFYYPVTQTTCPLAFATQRRRGQFGRINAIPLS